MATASEVITLAFREANYKNSVGTPTTEEFAEGLTLLQSQVDTLLGLVIGTKMMPWRVPESQITGVQTARWPASMPDRGVPRDVHYPPPNVRLIMKNDDTKTIYLPDSPDDGAFIEFVDAGHTGDVVLDGNGALIGIEGSVEDVEIPAVFPVGRNPRRRWIYREDYASWVEVATLALTSVLPFPTVFDDYFVTSLAIRLSPRYGSEPREVTLMRYKDMMTLIRLQYLQTKEVVVGTVGLTEQSYEFGVSSGNGDLGGP